MYWNPFEEIERMHEEMDRLFMSAYGLNDRQLIGHSSSGNNALARPAARNPVCHLQETESQMIASFELPGVNKGDIELNVDRDHIEVKVEQKQEQKKEDKEKGNYSYMSSSRSFHRYIPLAKEIDPNKAKAEYKNGVLRVEMPKVKEEKSSKRLQIE
ncbi:MAG: Hsp20/alpha crystallin family protein [Candidatus Woesearchaeota archaeon]|nr:Hsp20/alpha crystallin family protein [Candidatus Woesearchaeota archaeon]